MALKFQLADSKFVAQRGQYKRLLSCQMKSLTKRNVLK